MQREDKGLKGKKTDSESKTELRKGRTKKTDSESETERKRGRVRKKADRARVRLNERKGRKKKKPKRKGSICSDEDVDRH